jgi:hypothetical protein
MENSSEKNLELKFKLTNEYLRNGGLEKILDVDSLDDIINVKYDKNGNFQSESITNRLNSFMNVILSTHLNLPFYSPNNISEYSSILQKSIIFEQERIDTISQFDKIYDDLKNNTELLFRGQREAKWRLYNKLQREWILQNLCESESNYKDFITKLIENGKAKYKSDIEKMFEKKNDDIINDIAILGYLQHHKCPTPLLDWTISLQNAMYFGIEGIELIESVKEIDNYFSIYYIEKEHFENGSSKVILKDIIAEQGNLIKSELISKITNNEEEKLKTENHFKDRAYFDETRFFGSGLINRMTKISNMMEIDLDFFSDFDITSGLIYSLENNQNIINQKGVFSWNSDSTRPIELFGYDKYIEGKEPKEISDYRFCKCLNINKNLTEHISKRLNEDGINSGYIYPTKNIDTWNVFESTLSKNNASH